MYFGKKIDLFLFYLFRLPFNWRTPFGYFIALLAQCFAAISTLFCGTSTVCFLIGSCWLIGSFLKDLRNDVLIHLNRVEKMRSQRNAAKLVEHFHDIIQDHSDVKRFVSEFKSIYEFIILGTFIWSLVTVCCTLLVFSRQLVEYSNSSIPNPKHHKIYKCHEFYIRFFHISI